jgi:hypothetical protein
LKKQQQSRGGTERKALSSGYHSGDTNKVIAPQIPAQSPSDRSNVAIKDARVSAR